MAVLWQRAPLKTSPRARKGTQPMLAAAATSWSGQGGTLGWGRSAPLSPPARSPRNQARLRRLKGSPWRQHPHAVQGALPLEAARSLTRGLRPWCYAPTLPASHPAFATWQGFRQAEPLYRWQAVLRVRPSSNQRLWRAEPDRRQGRRSGCAGGLRKPRSARETPTPSRAVAE